MKILTDMNYQRKQIYFSIFFLIFLFSENCAIRALGLGLLSSSSTIDQNGKKIPKKLQPVTMKLVHQFFGSCKLLELRDTEISF